MYIQAGDGLDAAEMKWNIKKKKKRQIKVADQHPEQCEQQKQERGNGSEERLKAWLMYSLYE